MSGITKKSDEQKGAEAEVESSRKDLGPFVVAAETTRMAMLFTDAAKPDNPIFFANDSFLSLSLIIKITGAPMREMIDWIVRTDETVLDVAIDGLVALLGASFLTGVLHVVIEAL
jgi:hypothetical protein